MSDLHAERSAARQVRRVAIYVTDSPLSLNQSAAMRGYADAMGWITVAVIENDMPRLLHHAAAHAFDMVLCWRTSDLRDADAMFQRLSASNTELLALAQSCTALLE
jgi:hypothetical protein